jgi:hypothetical protein
MLKIHIFPSLRCLLFVAAAAEFFPILSAGAAVQAKADMQKESVSIKGTLTWDSDGGAVTGKLEIHDVPYPRDAGLKLADGQSAAGALSGTLTFTGTHPGGLIGSVDGKVVLDGRFTRSDTKESCNVRGEGKWLGRADGLLGTLQISMYWPDLTFEGAGVKPSGEMSFALPPLRFDPKIKPPERSRIADRATGVSSPSGLTPPFSVGNGLTVAGAMTFQRATPFQDGQRQDIILAQVSADGSRIAFATNKGVFVTTRDGTQEPIQFSELRPNWIDISANGAKIAWYIRGTGLFVADAKTRQTIQILSKEYWIDCGLRLSGDGQFILALRMREAGGELYRFGTGQPVGKPTALLTTEMVGQFLGRKKETNNWLWFGNQSMLNNADISDDGSRIVFRFGVDVLSLDCNAGLPGTMNNLTHRNANLSEISRVAISGDGKKIAYQVASPRNEPAAFLTIMDWDGQHTKTFQDDNFFNGAKGRVGALRFANDGSHLVVSGYGLHLFPLSGTPRLDATNWGNQSGAQYASVTADGRHACLVANGNPLPWVFADLRPELADIEPLATNIRLSARELRTDGSNGILITAPPINSELRELVVMLKRPNEPDLIGGPERLNDDGRGGDVKPKDGIYSATIRLPAGVRTAAGPLIVRIAASDAKGNATVIDIAGVEAREPSAKN